ncbi:MAG TPA: protein-glutamate O-methyltransferase CheR [Gemmatimonadaceae bacterium]|nr:protein-glutamate O-methyltransferase CheR [Gemmatimonadaceae bacterium]
MTEPRRIQAPFTLGNSPFALSDAAFALLRDFIVQRSGILFDESKRGVMADKLSELVAANGLTSFLDYYYLLRYDSAADAHWTALMNRLSVPETFFWRQPEQINALASVIAPAHFLAYPNRPLRIWSAGCCSGEEAVSLAIALAEQGLLDRQPIEIVATDASAEAIARAERGSYPHRSFRQLPGHLKAKYFVTDGSDRWRPIESLRRSIHWAVANLVIPEDVKRYAACDVIFCRNVFIYFSDDAIRSTVRLFTEYLSPDGFLFVGASESLGRLGVALELAEIGGAFTYVKLGRREVVEAAKITHTAAARGPVLTHHQGNP